MTLPRTILVVLNCAALFFMVLFSACQMEAAQPASLATELSVQVIPLSGPLAGRKAEISGMAWYGDFLVLLPQYPHKFGNAIFAISKQEILDYLSGITAEPITPVRIQIETLILKKRLRGYEGFEAIAFSGNQVFFTLETRPGAMQGYLVIGTISTDMKRIGLQYELELIPPQARLENYTDEAILVYQNQVFTIFEANGVRANPAPIAHRFDMNGFPLESVIFPNVEYRLTDVSEPDINGIFWALNVFFPMDVFKLNPATDFLAHTYGEGVTHSQNRSVERLVAFQILEQKIILADIPPIQLALESSLITRNWEALAALDQRGFLIATDKFPQTQLGFVPYPASPQP